jgi:4'-phosphopantetheinyl transferase EntD
VGPIESNQLARGASPSPLLSALFSPEVATAQFRGHADPGQLDPAERESTCRYAPKRLREFSAGRLCAKRALAELGVTGYSLRQGRDRRPIWPAGVVGSITHTDDFCGAVVASKRRILAIGVDAESVSQVTAELWPQICTPAEITWIQALPHPARERAAALIFSAKETYYKCCSTISDSWIDFLDAELSLHHQLGGAGRFVIRAARGGNWPVVATASFHGRYRFEGGLVLTGMAFSTRDGVRSMTEP